MIVPNKVISIEDSALSRLPVILDQGPEARDLVTLFHGISEKFESIDQFLLALDILFVLGRIEVDFKNRVLTYAE
jgi:hypothetical protein